MPVEILEILNIPFTFTKNGFSLHHFEEIVLQINYPQKASAEISANIFILIMNFLTNSTIASNPASKFKQYSRKRKNLRDHSNLNASEVIPQPCISPVTGCSHAVCWSIELVEKENRLMGNIFTRAM